MHSSIRTVGYVQYDEERIVHIHSRAEGWIETLYARSSGSSIEKGEPLYGLYSPEIVNAQKEFLLALRNNNQQLIEASESRLKVFHIDDKFIRQLAQDRQVQRTVTFYAPQSGILHNLNIREGFFVKPETTLMSIAALDEVWLEAQVFQRQAGDLNTGAAVSIRLDSKPEKIWRGVVDYIYPNLDAVTRTLPVRIRLANSSGELKPNMFAQVEIETKPHDISILVPKDAVIRTATENRVVLALPGGGFKSVVVELGHLNEQFAEIRSGIEAGDQVVISAQFLLDSESSKHSGLMQLSTPEPAALIDHKAMDHKAMDHSQMHHQE
jgi:Cu(I)/Ag(I) efflux system membrane fusion protein